MPDVELTVVCECEEQVVAIRREARHAGTPAQRFGIEYEAARAETAALKVEVAGVDVVVQLVVVVVEVGIDVCVTGRVVCRDIVERAAVRAPRGERLELPGGAVDVLHGVRLDIVENEVAGIVDDLHLLGVKGVEDLPRLVDGVGDEVQRGMPGGIDAGAESGVCLEVDLCNLVTADEEGTAHGLTNMELALLLLVPVAWKVAVDALALIAVLEAHILVDDTLVEVLEATLVEGQLFVGNVGRAYETVGDVGIYRLFSNKEILHRQVLPVPIRLQIDIAKKGVTLRLGKELVPDVLVKTDVSSANNHFPTLSGMQTRHAVGSLLVDAEIQWRNIRRQRGPEVIGRDRRLP